MRVALACVAAILAVTTTAEAQQPTPPESSGRMRAAVQSPSPGLRTPPVTTWADPSIKSFGVLTLVASESNGEFVRVVLPVGELAAQVRRSVAAARHRHAERNARKTLRRELQGYLTQRD